MAGIGSRPRRAQGAHAGLDLDAILDAAAGFDPGELTMRGLAAVLGVDHKALNHHVRDRDTLLDLLAWRTFSRHFDGDSLPETDWRATARTFAHASSDAAITSGHFAAHLRPAGVMAPNVMRYVERFAQQLLLAGFTDAEALRLIVGLANITLAHARDVVDSRSAHTRLRRDFVRSVLAETDAGAFPTMSRLLAEGIDTYGSEQLDLDITIFIEGASALLAQRTPPDSA